MFTVSLLAVVTAFAPARAETKITGLSFRVEPDSKRIRPFETAVVQVLVQGEITGTGDTKTGRLRKAGAKMTLKGTDAGWLSKPFKFQGSETVAFVSEAKSPLMSILEAATSEFVLQDSAMYVAPEKPGSYTIEAELEGKKAEVTIEVAADAPSTKAVETVSFQAERGNEPYRELAEHYAPFIAQETWFTAKADIPTRFDYDGDFYGDNNWENLDKGSSQAYVHYAVMETSSHWFVIYNLFHPRDYSDKCVAGTCHENDNEGLILAVFKDGSQFGRLQVLETLAHNNIYDYTSEKGMRNGLQDIDGQLELHKGVSPAIFVESGGHGIYGTADRKRGRYRLDKDEFTSGIGLTLVYKGVAERPRHPNDRLIGYDLLPIYDHWWLRMTGRGTDQRMFDEFKAYRPFNGRPLLKMDTVGMTFLGRKEASNKAKPFWGWFDNHSLKSKVAAEGQWGLDPAYCMSKFLTYPADAAIVADYVYNPYLGIGSPPVSAAPLAAPATPVAPNVSEPAGGSCDISAVVDGSAILHIQGSTMRSELLSGQPLRDERITCTAPLPAAAVSVTLEKRAGRGEAKVVAMPAEANGFDLAVRVDDPQRSFDRYELRLNWRR